MSSIKEDWEKFADPMKQAIINLGNNIKYAIDDLKYAVTKDKHSETSTKENSGCLKNILVYGFVIIAILAFLRNGCSFNSTIERDCVGETTRDETRVLDENGEIKQTDSVAHPSIQASVQGGESFETQAPTRPGPNNFLLGRIVKVRDYHEGVAWVQFEFPDVTKWCCCDMEGNILFSLDPESVPTTHFANGVSIVDKNRIVNKAGDTVWSLEQDGINAGNQFWGVGSVESIRIWEPNYSDFYGYTLVRFEVDCYDYTGEMTGVVDSNGAWRLKPVNDLTIENDTRGGINGVYSLGVNQYGEWYYDIVSNEFIDGNEYYARNNGYKIDEHDGLIYQEKQDPTNYFNYFPGFYDAEDNLVIDLSKYHMDTADGIPEFNEGYAILNIQNNQGSPYYTIIDTIGKEMFPPRKRVWHDELRCGYYWVYGVGYMNVYGEKAFDKEFINGTSFSEGMAFVTVKENNEYVKHCININGDIVY